MKKALEDLKNRIAHQNDPTSRLVFNALTRADQKFDKAFGLLVWQVALIKKLRGVIKEYEDLIKKLSPEDTAVNYYSHEEKKK